MPTLTAFLNLAVGVTLLIALCFLLRECWLRAVPAWILAYLIAPGVALHELSHAAGCVLTGAKVHKITLFREDGSGEVRHGPPKLRYPGDVIISLAPLVGCTVAFWLLGWALGGAVNFYKVSAQGVTPQTMSFVGQLLNLVYEDVSLVISTAGWSDWRTYLFFYFAFCISMAMAPSRQDLKNCGVGLLVLCGVALIIHLVVDRLIGVRGGPIFEVIANLLIKLHYPLAIVALSFVLCLVAFVVGMPFRGRRR